MRNSDLSSTKRTSENDSMSTHLLVEQAIYDSADYEILSYEEVEALKKENTVLKTKTDATKRKLTLESKVRDAALSLSRLSSKKKVRKSAASQDTNQGDEELTASSRKCKELSQELHKLESRAVEIQRRLLQHAAGILGSTHKAAARTLPGGEYTFEKDMEAFDDRSFYRTADKLDEFGEPRSSNRSSTVVTKQVDDSFVAERLEGFNEQFNQLLREATSHHSQDPPRLPDGAGGGIDEQLALLDHNIQFLRQYPPSAPQDPDSSRAAQELERTETILTTLWDMMATHDEEVRGQRMDQKQLADGYNVDYPDSDDDDDDDEGEFPDFTLSAFSSKAQKLLSKYMDLRRERDMLRERAAQQERGVEEDMKMMQEDLENVNSQVGQLSSLLKQRETDLATSNGKMQGIEEELIKRTIELEEARAALSQKEHEDVKAELERQLLAWERRYQDMKEDRDVTKAELEAIVEETDGRLKFLEDEIATLKEARKVSEEAHRIATGQERLLREQLEEKDREMEKMDQEIRELSSKVAELSTEVVMAKAELDTAYGSKSERAAATAEARAAAAALERANNQPQTIDPGLLSEIERLEVKNKELVDEIVALKNQRAEGASNEHLEKRCKILQGELDDLCKDFENLAKQSIEAEQERIKLEQVVDMLGGKLEHVETALAEERVRLLGAPSRNASVADIRSPARNNGESTTVNVLRLEFKKMVRDMKADQARALRVRCFLLLLLLSRVLTSGVRRPNKKNGGNWRA